MYICSKVTTDSPHLPLTIYEAQTSAVYSDFPLSLLHLSLVKKSDEFTKEAFLFIPISWCTDIFSFRNRGCSLVKESHCLHYQVLRGKEMKIYWMPTPCWRSINVILFNWNNHGRRNFISTSIFRMRRLRLTELDDSAKVSVVVRSGAWSGCCSGPCILHESPASHGAESSQATRWGSLGWEALTTPPTAALVVLKGTDSQKVKEPCLPQKYNTWARALASNPITNPEENRGGGTRGRFQVSSLLFSTFVISSNNHFDCLPK